MFTQAVLLAGGRGARLRPFTDTMPKPLVPIHGRPFLEHLITLLARQGIRDVLLLVGYRAEQIQQALGDGSRFGVRLAYSYTPLQEAQGVEQRSGVRIRNAAALLHHHFLLLYCDNYWPMNLAAMTAHYRQMGALASTTVYNNADGGGEYGRENNVAVGADGHVLRYDKSRRDPQLNGVDIGFFLLDRRVMDFMPSDNRSFEEGTLPLLVQQRALAAYRTDHPYYTITSPEFVQRTEQFLRPKQVVFLDRDGVINRKPAPHDYVKTWSELAFLPGAVEALQLLKRHGYQVFVVSNQRGIARGLMTAADLRDIHRQMTAALARAGVTLDGVYYCPHALDDGCECRKPKPGMLLQAAREHYLDLTQATLIGDDDADVAAGAAVGCRTIRLEPGRGLLDAVRPLL